jgi:hypothetical protein
LNRLRAAFPFTFSGSALAALSALVVWRYGVMKLDLVMLTAGALLLAMILLLACLTGLAAWFLRRRLRRTEPGAPVVLDCGTSASTGWQAPLSAWLPFLDLQVAWEAPAEVEARVDATGGEWIRGARRGAVEVRRRRITLGDILGLTALSWIHEEAAGLQLRPARIPLDRGLQLWGMAPGEDRFDPRSEPMGDPVDVRRYAHGDPMRMILWKVFARTRQLIVRMPERALAPAPRLCAYLPALPGDEPAARVARAVLEAGLLGEGWRFGADGSGPCETLDAALEALSRSGSLAAERPDDLSAFLRSAAADGFGACLLFLPTTEGPWVEAMARRFAEPALPLHALLVFTTWAEPAGPVWRRVVMEPASADGLRAEGALRMMRTLQSPELRCTLVNATEGTVLEEAEAYLAKRADADARRSA